MPKIRVQKQIKKQTGKMLIQNMDLKSWERFKVGRHIMVYVPYDGSKWDTIIPVSRWKKLLRESNI